MEASFAAYIGLGSNLNNPIEMIHRAIAQMPSEGMTVVIRSSIFRSLPYGHIDQPVFYNAVVGILSSHKPEDLLKRLLKIENELGRVRNERWGPRAIDLDIILFGDWVLSTPEIQIPHPDFRNRDFVLRPLMEIGRMVYDPITGMTIEALYQQLPKDTCTPVEDEPCP